jgi:hypothetical protein
VNLYYKINIKAMLTYEKDKHRSLSEEEKKQRKKFIGILLMFI